MDSEEAARALRGMGITFVAGGLAMVVLFIIAVVS